MSWAFPLPGPVVALASSDDKQARRAELSIVSLLDGEIGDPVTWRDQPTGIGVHTRDRAHDAQAFRAVADDIRAHLADGAVAVHGPGSTLGLVRRIIPNWRPTIVIDTLSLVRQEGPPPGADPDVLHLPAALGAGQPADAAARALATARLLLRLATMLPGSLQTSVRWAPRRL